ncbi:MAG: RIP metalloprotease RseP [Armatimonadota bacterium]
MEILQTAAALIFIFSFLVVAHEFGHYIFAKLSGMKVEEFAIGFGPKLFRYYKKNETEFTVHLIPLGGFVKIIGMEPDEEHLPDGFQAQSRGKRALTIFAGPLFSFLFGAAVFIFVGLYWGFPDGTEMMNRVGFVNPQTEAHRIGLRSGDTILKINGIEVSTGDDLINLIHKKPGEKLELEIERKGKILKKEGTPRWMVQYLGAAWAFNENNKAVLGAVSPESTAGKIGLKENDILLSINGIEIKSGNDMISQIEAIGTTETYIEVERRVNTENKVIRYDVKPEIAWVRFGGVKWHFPQGYTSDIGDKRQTKYSSETIPFREYDILVSIDDIKINNADDLLDVVKNKDDNKAYKVVVERNGDEKVTLEVPYNSNIEMGVFVAYGLLGFQPQPKLVKTGFVESIKQAISSTIRLAGMIVEVLTSKKIKEEVGGPIMIAKITSSAVAIGPYYVFLTMGGLSLSLAFINLLPIPIVDGGHLVLIGLEAIRKKKLTQRQMQIWQTTGFFILAIILFLVISSDISKLIGGNIPQ